MNIPADILAIIEDGLSASEDSFFENDDRHSGYTDDDRKAHADGLSKARAWLATLTKD